MPAMRRLRRWLAGVAIGLASPFVLYAAAALVLSRVPVNADFRSAPQGVLIGVIDGGVHADLILPVNSSGVDWRRTFRLSAFPRLAWDEEVLHFITLGWGHREFYLRTPTWADVEVGVMARSLLGIGGTVVHVAYWPPLTDSDNIAWVVIPVEAYRTLAAHVAGSLARDGEGRAVWIEGAAYRENDAFFTANGDYGPILTCNEWASRALSKAGVRTGLWTPFPGAILDHLRAISAD